MTQHFPAASLLLVFLSAPLLGEGPHLANGIKIGEVDSTSAIIWVRTTRDPQADTSIVDAAPGMEGSVAIVWMDAETSIKGGGMPALAATTDPENDFTHPFRLTDLKPGTEYQVCVFVGPIGSAMQGDDVTAAVRGRFRTAPAADQEAPVDFLVVTCQAISSVDCGEHGHSPYKLMPMLDADFFVHTGDIVYYDREPFCTNAALARQKWNRMYGYTFNRDFHSGIAAYFMKDDHDCLKDDCWPGQRYHDLTWEQGLAIFREQVPMGEKTYRTVRWGKDVQIWMTEGRDFRSPNPMRDGPEKTILGPEQKAWLEQTMKASDATFKFLIMPGPMIGPDKRGKSDNHANKAFQTEGDWIRGLVTSQPNTFVVNGDRHWQYHSVHPELGIREFGCGPINDLHNYGGAPDYDPTYHRFLSEQGGWLGVSVDRQNGTPVATFRYYATGPDIDAPQPRYEISYPAE